MKISTATSSLFLLTIFDFKKKFSFPYLLWSSVWIVHLLWNGIVIYHLRTKLVFLRQQFFSSFSSSNQIILPIKFYFTNLWIHSQIHFWHQVWFIYDIKILYDWSILNCIFIGYLNFFKSMTEVIYPSKVWTETEDIKELIGKPKVKIGPNK